jgi:hypothetical protein
LWRDERYLPGLADRAFCPLTISVWRFRIWGTESKEFIELFSRKSTAQTERKWLQHCAQKEGMWVQSSGQN